MRKEFSRVIEQIGRKNDKVIFLSGDLGYNALEGVQAALGSRFINMGVAEQSMVSAAAGMAYEGNQVFCYSIAPFIVYRCLEQTRNDVCFHDLPVFLVGNGGGYGYGIMGSSHHAIEDLACLSGLPNITCYVPAFLDDVEVAVNHILKRKKPAYLRLGLGKRNPFAITNTGFFNQLTNEKSPRVTVATLGPIINNVVEAIQKAEAQLNAELFSVTQFPYQQLPEEFLSSVVATKKLLVVEEHVSTGGLAQKIALDLMSNRIEVQYFKSLSAQGYPDSTYGSQAYHQHLSGLNPEYISEILRFCSNQIE